MKKIDESKKEDESQVIHSESTLQAFFDHAPKPISNLIITEIKKKELGKKQKKYFKHLI